MYSYEVVLRSLVNKVDRFLSDVRVTKDKIEDFPRYGGSPKGFLEGRFYGKRKLKYIEYKKRRMGFS